MVIGSFRLDVNKTPAKPTDATPHAIPLQGALKGSNQAWNVLTPRPGGNNLAYAWDEPTLEHKLLVHVRCVRLRSDHIRKHIRSEQSSSVSLRLWSDRVLQLQHDCLACC